MKRTDAYRKSDVEGMLREAPDAVRFFLRPLLTAAWDAGWDHGYDECIVEHDDPGEDRPPGTNGLP